MEQVPRVMAGQVEGVVNAARPNRVKNRTLDSVQGQIGTPTLPVAGVPERAVAGAEAVKGPAVVCSRLVEQQSWTKKLECGTGNAQ